MRVNSIISGGNAVISPIATAPSVLKYALALRAISVFGAIACVMPCAAGKDVNVTLVLFENLSSSPLKSSVQASISRQMLSALSRNYSIPLRTRPQAARTTNRKITMKKLL